MSSLSLKVESDEVVVQLNENKENSDFQIIESAEEKKEGDVK